MQTFLLTIAPLLCGLAVLVFAITQGVKHFRSGGGLSGFFVPGVLLGLVLGRFLDAVSHRSNALQEWIDYQIGTKLSRYEAVLSIEVAVLIVSIAGLCLIATMLFRDRAAPPKNGKFSGSGYFFGAFGFAIAITAREVVAAYAALILARLHLLP